MSDIDTQIENNKISIQDFKQRIEELNREIDNIKKRLTNKTIKLTDALKQIDLRKKQIKIYNTNINTLNGLNKDLERVNPTKSKKNTDDEELLEELNKIVEEENIKKTQQQKQNLSEREKAYEEKTGKKYNPLVTDDDENISLAEPLKPLDSISSVSSSKLRQQTPPIESSPSKNKTKKKRPTPEGIELEDLNRNKPTPEQVPLDNVDINEDHFTAPIEKSKILQPLGFRETLIPSVKKESVKLDENICQNIFTNGLKVNKGHFFPSQFPKLTRIKPITVSNKKGGKIKSRKRRTTVKK